MKSFGLTDKGKVRKDNQDCFIIESCPVRSCLIAALCDGMGGENAGEIASAVANKAFVSYIYDRLTSRTIKNVNYEEVVTNACAEANGVAYEYSLFDKTYSGMGTTLVAALIQGDCATVINVGDSRAYRFDGEAMHQISEDHSYVEEMRRRGKITEADARTHPQKNLITRAVGVEPYVEGDLFEVRLNEKDMLLLCSDGLTGMAEDSRIAEVLANAPTLELAGDALLQLALNGGGRDNITVALFTLGKKQGA